MKNKYNYTILRKSFVDCGGDLCDWSLFRRFFEEEFTPPSCPEFSVEVKRSGICLDELDGHYLDSNELALSLKEKIDRVVDTYKDAVLVEIGVDCDDIYLTLKMPLSSEEENNYKLELEKYKQLLEMKDRILGDYYVNIKDSLLTQLNEVQQQCSDLVGGKSNGFNKM